MKISIKCRVILAFFVLAIFNPLGAGYSADQERAVFSTWEGFEVDKCASIWLIKRFINKNARIIFFAKGENINEGIPFDTPEAQFRRYHNMSTFESLLKHYDLKDPGLLYMGKIIHDVEVNIWERKIMKETLTVQQTVNNIIENSQNNNKIIQISSGYFESLYISVLQQMNEVKINE